MAVNTFNNNHDVYRTFRTHVITTSGDFVSTAEWKEKANASYNGTPDYALDNPISHIKATAEERVHDTTGTDAYYSQRVTAKVGTCDEKLVGLGWTDVSHADHPNSCWLRVVYLDEAEELLGPFDYVELDLELQDESITAYEIID